MNLDKDPVEMAISNEVFRMLKRSNALRFKVLSSLFTRVGLNCSKSDVPALTVIHLLTKSKVWVCLLVILNVSVLLTNISSSSRDYLYST